MRKKKSAKVQIKVYLQDGRVLDLHYDKLAFIRERLKGYLVDAIQIEKAILETRKDVEYFKEFLSMAEAVFARPNSQTNDTDT